MIQCWDSSGGKATSISGEEQFVKHTMKWVTLISAALISVFILSACSSASTPEETQEATPIAETVEPSPEGTATPESALSIFTTTDIPPTAEPVTLDGATVTNSGLQFLEITKGTGRSPEDGDLITMLFTGSLPDGTVFTNSTASEEPISAVFGQEQLLPGWEEGIALMKAGGKARMVLPPELAFGEQGFGMIPPNSQIILEVELVSVEVPPQPSAVSDDELVTTDSGLQYADLTEGKGAEAEQASIVSTHFTIWVQGDKEDEFVFSSEGGDPVSFIVGGGTVFPGWEEGVLNMKQGGVRQLVIPPDLALGEAGGNGIPPNATVVMEIELVEVREPITMTDVDEDDYTTTESGLKYYDLVEGKGDMPEAGQTVVVHYTGWLEDGTQFDSSLNRGTPFTFTLGQGSVIQGWDEGLATMKVGGKRQLVIPPDLGYGDQGSGGTIPPGATLIFEVELLEIQP
jgi:peptidylprolyl isomerase